MGIRFQSPRLPWESPSAYAALLEAFLPSDYALMVALWAEVLQRLQPQWQGVKSRVQGFAFKILLGNSVTATDLEETDVTGHEHF